MKRKIILVSFNQFGYFSIYYNYCICLKTEFDIFYLCFDEGLPKMYLENVDVTYIKLDSNKIKRQILFYLGYRRLLHQIKPGNIIIKYFKFCSIYKLLHLSYNIYVDIRTGYFYRNKLILKLANFFIKTEAIFFDHILVLSESLSRRLGLPASKTSIIPLGAKEFFFETKDFNEFRMLYVGVISNRKIIDTIEGLKLFLSKNENTKISYEIIGYGKTNEEKELLEFIKKYDLGNIVTFHGRIFGTGLDEYLNKCNLGVAYLPITDGYNVQPLTKVFEYLFAGMPVIATRTSENQKIISGLNGILIDDNPLSFSEGLEYLVSKKDAFNSEVIKGTIQDYSWRKIMETKLIPLLN